MGKIKIENCIPNKILRVDWTSGRGGGGSEVYWAVQDEISDDLEVGRVLNFYEKPTRQGKESGAVFVCGG